MATKKQKREAALAKHHKRMSELKAEGLQAQAKARQRREEKAKAAKEAAESPIRKQANAAAAALIHGSGQS